MPHPGTRAGDEWHMHKIIHVSDGSLKTHRRKPTQTQWGAATQGSQAWAVRMLQFSGLKAVSLMCMLVASPKGGPIHWGCGC